MDHSEVKHLPKIDHTPAELDGASRLLLKAANLIEERGWCQHKFSTQEGLCIQGALITASSGVVNHHIAFMPRDAELADERVERALGIGTTRWNDAPSRTKEEVVAKLRAVALGG